MTSPSQAAYDSTTLDRDRLRRYAQRVASGTRVSPAPAIRYTHQVQEPVERTVEHPGRFFGWGKPRQTSITTARWVTTNTTAIGPHWLLDRRTWHMVETSRNSDRTTTEESTHEGTSLVLLPSGELRLVVVSETTVILFGDPRSTGMVRAEAHHSVLEPDDADICRLDFALHWFERRYRDGNRQRHIQTDRVPGRRLLRHAKGVGVNLALKALLDGAGTASAARSTDR